MKWIGKYAPTYIYLDDLWERETDHKIFKTDDKAWAWVAEDGEKVAWHKNAKPKRIYETASNRKEPDSTAQEGRGKEDTSDSAKAGQ